MSEITMTFAERLSELMEETGKSINHLASEAGVSRESVRLWKLGGHSVELDKFIRLAECLDCDLDYLAGRSDVRGTFGVGSESAPFDEILRSVMRESGVSRYRMVKDLHMYDSYFTNWKKGGMPNLITLVRIADYLDVSLDRLVGRESR